MARTFVKNEQACAKSYIILAVYFIHNMRNWKCTNNNNNRKNV